MNSMIRLILFFIAVFSFSATALESASYPMIKVNLNTVKPELLAGVFKGIGKKRAQAIVSYRTEHGPFKLITDLGKVKGLGRNFVKTHLNELQQVFVID